MLSGSDAAPSIQGRRRGSNTSGRARTHRPLCWQSDGRHCTVSGPAAYSCSSPEPSERVSMEWIMPSAAGDARATRRPWGSRRLRDRGRRHLLTSDDRLQRERERESGELALEQDGIPARIVAEPDLRLAVLRKDAVRLDGRPHDGGGEVSRADTNRLLPEAGKDDRIAVGAEIAVIPPRLSDPDAGAADGIDERAVVQRVRDAGVYRVALLVRATLGVDLIRRGALVPALADL